MQLHCYAYRHILKEKVTPIVLDIKQEAKDQHQVAQADEDDHHHASVHRAPVHSPSHALPPETASRQAAWKTN